MIVHVSEPNKGIFCLHASIDMYFSHVNQDCNYEKGYRIPNWLRTPSLSITLFVIHNNDVRLSVWFSDDFSSGESLMKDYTCDFSNYRQKTHELLNWMKDQENRVVDFAEPFSADWFPEI